MAKNDLTKEYCGNCGRDIFGFKPNLNIKVISKLVNSRLLVIKNELG